MSEMCRDRIDLSPSTEEESSALQKALLAECDHLIRKSDALLADMRKFYKEQEWLYLFPVSSSDYEIRLGETRLADVLDMGASWYGGNHTWQIRPTDETLKRGIGGSSNYKSPYEALEGFEWQWKETGK